MAHVQIRSGDGGGALSVVVDGVDISQNVYTQGFGLVRVGNDDGPQEWGLSLVIPVGSLDLDLPDVVVEALTRAEGRAKAIEAD